MHAEIKPSPLLCTVQLSACWMCSLRCIVALCWLQCGHRYYYTEWNCLSLIYIHAAQPAPILKILPVYSETKLLLQLIKHTRPHMCNCNNTFFLSFRITSISIIPSPHSTKRMTGVHRRPRCYQSEPARSRAAAQTQNASATNAAATMAASMPAWSLCSHHQVSRTSRLELK